MYESARKKVASFFGAKESDLAFTQNATDSLNFAAASLGAAACKGKNVVVTSLEHNSALMPWMRICETTGAQLRFIPLSREGTPDLRAAAELTDENTVAAVFTAGSNVSGYRAPLGDVSELFSKKNTPLIIDATQAAPHEKIDVQTLKFDFICFSAHKMYGPMGIGAVIAGSDRARGASSRLGGGTADEVSMKGYVRKSGFTSTEAGTPDVAGAIAFGAAVDYLSSLPLISLWENEKRLANHLRAELSRIGAKIAPCGNDPLPVVSFDPVFMDPLDAAHVLGALGFCVRSGRHCAHVAHDALGFGSTVRVSLGIYNGDDDIAAFIDAMKMLKGRYGNDI